MKKTLSVILSLLMIITTLSALPFTAHALDSGKCGPYVTYGFDSSTGTLTLVGGGDMYDYEMGKSPFYGNTDIKEVVFVDKFSKGIPGGVSGYIEKVGDYAFAQCSNLETVSLASSNSNIGRYAFYGCTKLSNIKLPKGIGWIDEGAFAGCANITNVKLGKNMTVIKNKAFADCAALKTVTISDKITTVEDLAFINCTKLKDVYYLGSDAQWNAMSIGTNNTCLTDANIHHYEEGSCGANVNYHMDFNTGTMLISGTGEMDDYDLGKEPPWDQYKGRKITKLIVEEGVTRIGQLAFHNCYELTTVSIPYSLSRIGDLAFRLSNAITDVYYASSETRWETVRGTSDLKGATIHFNSSIPLESGKCGENATYTIDINHQLTISGTDAMYDYTGEPGSVSPFAGKTDIKSVVIEDGITSVGDMSFDGCSGINSVSLAGTVSTIGINAFKDCTGLQSFEIPNSITELGRLAFSGCTGITSIKLPKVLSKIGENAFENCTALNKVNIPENVKTIGNSAFKGCLGLTDLTIAEGVQVISDSSFMNCSGLTEVEIPDSVTTISNRAFAGCNNLTTAHIGSGVKTIGTYLFNNASKLTDVYYNGTEADWNSITINTPNSNLISATKHFYQPNIKNGTCGDSVSWNLDTLTGALTISGTGAMPDYSAVDDPEYTQHKNSIKSIVIKNGITSIGKYAFYDLPSVTDVSIPDSVTKIDEKAFKQCVALKNVTIGSGVTSIESEAFDSCSSLSSVNYTGTDEAWNTVKISGNNAPLLAAKNQADGISSGSCGENVTYSFDSAKHTLTISGTGEMTKFAKMTDSPFYNNEEIQSVVIEDGVTTIGQFAFASCGSLTSITIPASVTRIYSKAFYGTNLTDVYYMGTEEQWGELAAATSSAGNDKIKSATKHYTTVFGGSCGESVNWSLDTTTGVLTISGSGAMTDFAVDYPEYEAYKNSITSIVIENGVTLIGAYAFYQYKNVASVSIAATVTTIGSSAFSGCSALTSVVIPNGVTVIENYAFNNCTSITSITIPESVTSIEENAFHNCDALTQVNYGGTDEQWQSIDLGLGNGSVTAIKPHDISGTCGTAVNYTVKSDGTLIISGTGAMDDFDESDPEYYSSKTDVKKIIVENGVTYIGKYAFYMFSNVTSVSIADSVTEIGEAAFNSCISLTSVSISADLTVIGEDAFGRCNSLSDINVDGANPNYSSLDGVLFNKDKTTLIQYPREKAGASYSIPNSVTVIDDSAFGHTALESMVIPDSVKTIGDYAFSSCENLKNVAIGNGVTNIGTSAFTYCDALKTVTLGSSVKNIGVNAFFDCESLESINIPDSVTTIGADAFFCASDSLKVTSSCNHPLVPAILEGTSRVWNKTHNYSKTVTPATCTDNGYTTYTCSGCSDSYVSDYVNALGHTEVTDEAVAPTCTETGLTEGKHCATCGWVQTAQQTIPATGHSWNGGKVTTEPTAIDEGVKTFTCTTCGATRTEKIAKYKPTKTNPATVEAVKTTPTVKASTLKKKDQTIPLKKVVKVQKTKGKVTYYKASGNKKISINATSGKITLKKGLKKGTYKVKMKVQDHGTKKFKAKAKTVAFKIKVK